jgi:hypothetical protein
LSIKERGGTVRRTIGLVGSGLTQTDIATSGNFSKTITVRKTAVAGTALLSATGGTSGLTITVPVTIS